MKTPLVYTSVALRNWQAFDKLKVHRVYAPGSYHTYFHLNPYVDIGAYRSTKSPSDPILVHMGRTPCKPGLSEHDQNRAGRAELLATSFETFERNIRDQLARTLAGGGFDPARDITAITVNRWPQAMPRSTLRYSTSSFPRPNGRMSSAGRNSAGLASRIPTRAAPHTPTRRSTKGTVPSWSC